MKRLLKDDQFSIRVEVAVESYVDEKLIAASDIKPVRPNYPEDNYIDEQALADYDSFIEESIMRIEDCDLEVLERNVSKKSVTSRYFSIVDLTQDTENTAAYMIFLRISDHIIEGDPERMKEIQRDVREHRKYYAKKYGSMQGHKVTWKVRQVIVNGSRFDSYDEAIEYIAKLAEQWAELLRNNSYQE